MWHLFSLGATLHWSQGGCQGRDSGLESARSGKRVRAVRLAVASFMLERVRLVERLEYSEGWERVVLGLGNDWYGGG